MEPSLSEINAGVIAVAQNVAVLASGAQVRANELVEVRLRMERVQGTVDATATGVERLNNILDGNNGSGLKSRVQSVEIRLKVVEDQSDAKGKDRRVIYAMIATFILSMLGSLIVAWIRGPK